MSFILFICRKSEISKKSTKLVSISFSCKYVTHQIYNLVDCFNNLYCYMKHPTKRLLFSFQITKEIWRRTVSAKPVDISKDYLSQCARFVQFKIPTKHWKYIYRNASKKRLPLSNASLSLKGASMCFLSIGQSLSIIGRYFYIQYYERKSSKFVSYCQLFVVYQFSWSLILERKKTSRYKNIYMTMTSDIWVWKHCNLFCIQG